MRDSEEVTKTDLTLTTRKCEPGVTVFGIGGSLALGRESGQIEAAVLQALDEGVRRIVIDLSEVGYIDSTGIGIVTYCFNKISQRKGLCAIAGAHGLVLEVFRITRIHTIIPFYPDLAAACAAFTPASASA
jgi:anti-sigma B factor antagonist